MAVIEVKNKADISRLRRVALARQGLLSKSTFGRGLPGALKAIERIGYVQIDTISVIERAHHHVWQSRVENFRPNTLTKLLANRCIFEYWAHAAAFLPMRNFRFSLPEKLAIQSSRRHGFHKRDKRLMAKILDRVRNEGGLRSRDLEDSRTSKGTWWDWKPTKVAIEQLYFQGDLMIASRDGFEKTYDLTERVLPNDVDTTMPTIAEHAVHLIDEQLACHGIVTLKGITYGRRDAALRQAVKQVITERCSAGLLDEIRLNGVEKFYCEPGVLDEPARTSHRAVILSPFDNAVIQRDRAKSLFGFEYFLECYVPASKRRFGYFTLPILYRDEFIARMDCKTHRDRGELEVRSFHFEDGVKDHDKIVDAIESALDSFAQFQGCEEVIWSSMTARKFRLS